MKEKGPGIRDGKDLVVKLLDLALVPTSVVRLMRDYDLAGEFGNSNISRIIGYSSAAGYEICRLGVYYSIAHSGLENLF
jgi:hypothetical protein